MLQETTRLRISLMEEVKDLCKDHYKTASDLKQAQGWNTPRSLAFSIFKMAALPQSTAQLQRSPSKGARDSCQRKRLDTPEIHRKQ